MAAPQLLEHRKGGSGWLPVEMLERVFRLLPPRDLKVVVAVCRRWREVGEAPSLWTWVYLKVVGKNLWGMVEALGSRRLQAATRIIIRAVSRDLLRALLDHSGMRSVTFGVVTLASLEPELLAESVTSVESVHLEQAHLTCHQSGAILAAISSGCRLKRLNLSGTNLSSIPPGLVGRAIPLLEEATLTYTSLTTLQLENILSSITMDSKLTRLNLGGCNLSAVPPELLGALCKLESLAAAGTSLTKKQVESMFTIINNNPPLRNLNLADMDLSSVEPMLMAKAVAKLREADLHSTGLSAQNVETMLRHFLRVADLRLRRLRLGRVHGWTDQGLTSRAKSAIPELELFGFGT